MNDVLNDLTTQLAALDNELMSKYEQNSRIGKFIVNSCIMPLLDNARLEAYIEEHVPLSIGLSMPVVDFIFHAMRSKEDCSAIAPLWIQVLDSLQYNGDAYFVTRFGISFDRIQEGKLSGVKTLMLIGGDDHIKNLTPFFTELFGKPINQMTFDPSKQVMTPEYLSTRLK